MCSLKFCLVLVFCLFQGLSMTLLFTLGYVGIFVEEIVGLNKAGVALVMAVSLWTIYSNGAAGPVSQAGWLAVDAGHAWTVADLGRCCLQARSAIMLAEMCAQQGNSACAC